MVDNSSSVPNGCSLLEGLVGLGATISDLVETYPGVTDIYFDANGIEVWVAHSRREGKCLVLFGPDYRAEGLTVEECVQLAGKLIERDFERLQWPIRSVSLKFILNGEKFVTSRTSMRPLLEWEMDK